jgi:hypothetical protein
MVEITAADVRPFTSRYTTLRDDDVLTDMSPVPTALRRPST